MAKLMVSIRDESFRLLSLEATERGISIQELLRAVIVPEWVRSSGSWATQRETGPLQKVQTPGKETDPIPVYGRQRS